METENFFRSSFGCTDGFRGEEICFSTKHHHFQFLYYSGQLKMHEETVEDLVSATCLLQMTEVREACEEFLARRLLPANCLGMIRFGEQRDCLSLKRVAFEYALVSQK
ncbi:unnamed protein product [Protopolystoma xenopodis]|uniref:BTB domain-containing protein n=1 Tax=Protopolystoma xenopodis TaxID=117903 RepID=A0A448WA20_9PLAT|nr:unnamed protein product [Protopolystoma xenopodis]